MDAVSREGQAPPLHYDDVGKSGRSNDGFSQHHGIKKRGALVSVPLSGTGDGNRTRMAQCRGILRLVSHPEDSGSTRNYRFKTH